MERNPLLIEPVSEMGMDFQFPVAKPAAPNDIVFCGKVIVRQTESTPAPKDPFLSRSESIGRLTLGRTSSGLNSGRNKRSDSLRSSSTSENRCSRTSSTRKRYGGLFGILRFPLQMELSDIKERQGRNEPVPLPAFPGDDNGESAGAGKSCWALVRSLKRRNHLMSVLAKTSFGCLPVV